MQKNVLITGASSGIGFETAKIFAENNYKIIALGRNVQGLKKLQEEIGKEHTFIQFDLSKTTQIPDLIKKIESKIDNIDILINNAGIGLFKKLEDINDNELTNIININLIVPIILTREVLNSMKEKGGTILNVSSVAGKRTWKHLTIYSASKFGLIGFSNSLRRECKYHNYPINIIVVCPPATDTNFFENAGYKNYEEEHLRQNIISPKFVAREIYNAVVNKKREVLITGRAKILDKFSLLFPRFIENLEDILKNNSHKH